MSKKTVYTKDELKKAKEQKIDKIIVKGELANKLHKSKKISKLGKGAVALLIASVGAAPITGGLSTFALAPVAAATGLQIAAIIAAATVGIALIIAVFKEYDEIKYKDGELILKRKRD
ncbi:hypothetical protein SAMN04488598_1714 [Halanaerobium congolense]|uniref:Uncharacterized protein n=1 Tax=Halanaerobium congolense TaxID=54121 RepID=A0A1I0CR50_9FIRM|nr:hypothetical protein [Halanaerobium congolense]PTX14767.1 hypothetical protein C7953_2828 [Halanaerobium congolense]SDG25396.1 hypothetical protein SAMN04488598_1714 [Halanaerobium congolense]SET22146.1 hypothetical protein SAMN04515652_14224 [Halanaerobium congolense]SFP80977.1 hypothetical protein SAMN04488596_1693 [Halanaerobium congolense]